MAGVTASGSNRRHREDVPSLRVTPPDAARPPVPAAYMPLFTYLDHQLRRHGVPDVRTDRSAARIRAAVTTGVFADAEWWTGPSQQNDRHSAAWTAARRGAEPRQLRAPDRRVRAPSVIPGALERNVQPLRDKTSRDPGGSQSVSIARPQPVTDHASYVRPLPSPRAPGHVTAVLGDVVLSTALVLGLALAPRPCRSGRHRGIGVHPGRAWAAVTRE